MKITNNFSLPTGIFNAISNDTYDGPKVSENRISVTTLISPVKMYYLKKRHWDEIEEDASDRLWSLLGTAVHSILEKAESKNNIVEERIDKEVDGIVISGKMDIMDESCIEDYKVTSVWQYVRSPKDGKPEHQAQLNILRWLVRDIFPNINRLTINMILRDWKEPKYDSPGYPPIPFASIPMRVWSYDECLEYIKGRIAQFKAAKDLPDDDLCPCSEAEMWEKKGTFALMKKGRKSAVKLYDTKEEADAAVSDGMYVEARPGERIRCEKYCVVKNFCKQYAQYKASIS